jgi:hypothetical protein
MGVQKLLQEHMWTVFPMSAQHSKPKFQTCWNKNDCSAVRNFKAKKFYRKVLMPPQKQCFQWQQSHFSWRERSRFRFGAASLLTVAIRYDKICSARHLPYTIGKQFPLSTHQLIRVFWSVSQVPQFFSFPRLTKVGNPYKCVNILLSRDRNVETMGTKTVHAKWYFEMISVAHNLNCTILTGVPTNFFFRWRNSPIGPGPPHYRCFTITLRHITIRRAPLDEWSARRRDLYLTTHNTHKRQTSMPPGGIRTRNPS